VRREPRAAYRVQLTAEDGFDDVAARVAHLRRLGVSHLYTSPVLTAVGGSRHGYDGVDPTTVSAELGGRDGLARLVATLHRAGMGWLADLVPNHLSVAVPGQNPLWWATLRDGPGSPAAGVFDVDWAAGEGRVVLPVLARPLREVLADGGAEIVVARGDTAVSIDGYVVPLRRDVEVDPAAAGVDLGPLLDRQHHRLVPWRDGGRNYRVFFDIDSLAGVRVDDPDVFDLVHEEVARWLEAGWLDGVRVDHVDGLARPGEYLRRLRELIGPERWLLVEKIVLVDEAIPGDWPVDGTTGYEHAAEVARLMADPAGEAPLTEGWEAFCGDTRRYADIEHAAKAEVVGRRLAPELHRVAALADVPPAVVAAAACAFDVYRTYLPEGSHADRRRVTEAFARAGRELPDAAAELDRLQAMVVRPVGWTEREVQQRFQQLTAPVMAKGAEDTAFYRYHRLVALNEVGADPARLAVGVEEFHRSAARRQATHPRTLLTSSTHDTKRSEDVRARLLVLSEIPAVWRAAVARWHERTAVHRAPAGPDPATEYLLWQSLVGAWPIDADRLAGYLVKAAREAGVQTSWLDPASDYEAALDGFTRGVLADDGVMADVGDFVAGHLVEPGRVNSLSQVLLRTTSPGVPDVYQGCEVWDLSLVDPDNRRPVDWRRVERTVERCARIDGRAAWAEPDAGLPKAYLLTRALDLRRRRPELFGPGGGYVGLGDGSERRFVAYSRGAGVVALAPLRPVTVAREGWCGAVVVLPRGRWQDVLCPDRHFEGGAQPIARLLETFPVGLFERV
jgi:(1->4)-alpha-D-glucan 1-alpha-D-glucosylmutase